MGRCTQNGFFKISAFGFCVVKKNAKSFECTFNLTPICEQMEGITKPILYNNVDVLIMTFLEKVYKVGMKADFLFMQKQLFCRSGLNANFSQSSQAGVYRILVTRNVSWRVNKYFSTHGNCSTLIACLSSAFILAQ